MKLIIKAVILGLIKKELQPQENFQDIDIPKERIKDLENLIKRGKIERYFDDKKVIDSIIIQEKKKKVDIKEDKEKESIEKTLNDVEFKDEIKEISIEKPQKRANEKPNKPPRRR